MLINAVLALLAIIKHIMAFYTLLKAISHKTKSNEDKLNNYKINSKYLYLWRILLIKS